MSTKSFVMLGMFVGSSIGSYLPILFGADPFSLWTLLTGTIGGFIGIWAGWRLANF